MARRRVRAAERKSAESAVHNTAHLIADGVYHVARETLEGTRREDLPLPIYVFAPLAYATEMMGTVLCEQHELAAGRAHEVGQYLLAGAQEVLVAAFSGFDVDHFERWIAALSLREGEATG